MIVLGLLVLLAAGGLAVSGITTRDDGAHSPARSGLLGYHLPGPGSGLFFFGLVLAAATMSGLARMVAGLARGVRRLPAPRRLPGGNAGPGRLAAHFAGARQSRDTPG
jgi:hypothetical protein